MSSESEDYARHRWICFQSGQHAQMQANFVIDLEGVANSASKILSYNIFKRLPIRAVKERVSFWLIFPYLFSPPLSSLFIRMNCLQNPHILLSALGISHPLLVRISGISKIQFLLVIVSSGHLRGFSEEITSYWRKLCQGAWIPSSLMESTISSTNE